MPKTQRQLLITLVHGTWGRGFFPRQQRRSRRPLWFEKGSPFLTRLSTGLGDIPHKVTPLLWSGANSIFVRDKTAQVLAEHLSAEHDEHPQATQLVIAHSHGGNIALRALHHLRERDASQLQGTETSKPFVATLASPFIEVHLADFGIRPNRVRHALWLAMVFMLWIPFVVYSQKFLFDNPQQFVPKLGLTTLLGVLLFVLICLAFWWRDWWINKRVAARQNQVKTLHDATHFSKPPLAQRLLVVSAVTTKRPWFWRLDLF